MESHKIYLYPVWLRVWHGVNALCIILLIVSGVSMQYSDVQFPFLRFDMAVTMHNATGVIASLSYLCFIVGNLVTKNGLQYRIKAKGVIDRLILQSKYYLFGYFKGEPKPYPISEKFKFNPLQQIAYFFAMYMFVPLVIVSGIALLYPGMIIDRFFNMGGIQLTAIVHAAIGFLISLFLVIHLYVASVGKNPLKNYRSIVTGYHED